MIGGEPLLKKVSSVFLIIIVIGAGFYFYLAKSFDNTFQPENNLPADIGDASKKDSKNISAEEKMKDYLDLNMNGKIKGESDEIMVIKSYRITESDVRDTEASFTVVYKCAAGGYEFDADGKPVRVKDCTSYFSENSDEEKANNIKVDQQNSEETVIFNLEKDRNGWKIVSPALPAHISVETFLEYTRELLGNSADMSVFNSFFKK